MSIIGARAQRAAAPGRRRRSFEQHGLAVAVERDERPVRAGLDRIDHALQRRFGVVVRQRATTVPGEAGNEHDRPLGPRRARFLDQRRERRRARPVPCPRTSAAPARRRRLRQNAARCSGVLSSGNSAPANTNSRRCGSGCCRAARSRSSKLEMSGQPWKLEERCCIARSRHAATAPAACRRRRGRRPPPRLRRPAVEGTGAAR